MKKSPHAPRRSSRGSARHLALTMVLLAAFLSSPAWAEPPEPKAAESKQDPPKTVVASKATPVEETFLFGSYGRVSTGSDLHGGQGREVQVVSHPPRLLEPTYVELDFGYLHKVNSTQSRFHTRATLALGDELFHRDGDFDASLAIRNLYLEGQRLFVPGLSIWAGSRMYRGDDIYLLDFWPLDEQNTVGGGVAFSYRDTHVRGHVGVNRLDDDFQTQTVEVPGEELGSREVLFLNRQKLVTSLRGEQHLTLVGKLRFKGVVYGETHHLPSGTLRRDNLEEEDLPSDSGWLGGIEASLYGFGRASHVNLFARYGNGLAAYDELAVPSDLSGDKTTSGADELLTGVSANYERSDFGVLLGGYARYFVDADTNEYDNDDRWEVGSALRPAWFVNDHFHLVTEVNVQYLRPNGISHETGQQEIPVVWQLGLMPSLSLGRGSYSRPQLRFLYAATFLNEAARLTYAPEDIRRSRSVQHFLGLSVEWWFNSSRG